MPEQKKAAEGAKVQKFCKDNSMKVVTAELLEVYAGHSVEFKTALKEVFDNNDPPAGIMELGNVRKKTVNDRRATEGLQPLVAVNAINERWDALPEVVREKAITAHIAEKDKRTQECGQVFKEIITNRLGDDISDEVKRGEEFDTALLNSDIIWLVKRIRKVRDIGASDNDSAAFEKLKQLKQDSSSFSTHLVQFSARVAEMVRAGGWSKAELDDPESLQAKLVKSTLIDSLTLKANQSIIAGALATIKQDKTLTFEQMSTKLVQAEASQAEIDAKTGVLTKKERKALAAASKRDDEKEEKKEEAKDAHQEGSWKRGNRGGRGKGRGGGRGDNNGRGGGGRGDNNNAGRGGNGGRGDYNNGGRGESSGRGGGGGRGGGRGGGGRGGGGRGREGQGDRDNDRGGRGRGSYGNSRDDQERDNDQGYSSSNWRSDNRGAYKRPRFDGPRTGESFIIVCNGCREQRCQCDEDNGRGRRKVGAARAQVHYEDDDYEDFDFDEEPYRNGLRRNCRRAEQLGRYSSVNGPQLQFDTGADIIVLNGPSQHLQVKSGGPSLSITGITGETVTPSKSGRIGQIEAVEDRRFSAPVAPGMALLKANPGFGAVMTSDGMKIVDDIGMRKIKAAIESSDVVACGEAKDNGWFLSEEAVGKLANGTPKKRSSSGAGWGCNDDRVKPSPHTEEVNVRAVIRRRPAHNLQPVPPSGANLTPAAMKLATEAQQVRDALHPSDAQLHYLLENNLVDTLATAEDGRNAQRLFGPDWPRQQAVLKRPARNKESQNRPATEVGEVVSGDLHLLAKTNLLSTTDHHSAYQHVESLGASKSTKSCEEGVKAVVKDYNKHKHTVGELRFDSEANLMGMAIPQGLGINVTHHPPGQHAVYAESHYQRVQEKYLTILNQFGFRFDQKKHPHMAMQLMKTAGDILNLLPNERTGPNVTPFQLFTGKKLKLKPENLVPLGTMAIVKDWNLSGLDQDKSRVGIIVGYNLQVPGSFYIYDPSTGRKPELEFLASNKDIIDHDAAMRMVDQWDGFKRHATLNRPMQLVPLDLEEGPLGAALKEVQEMTRQVREDVSPVLVRAHVQDGVQEAAHVPAQALVQEGVRGQVQEGVQAQVQEDVQVQAQVQGQAMVDDAAPEGAASGGVREDRAAPQTPAGERAVPAEPPPIRSATNQSAPQQEGESAGPAPQGIAADLRAAYFTLRQQDNAVFAAEVTAAIDKLDELVSVREVHAAKKKPGANSGTQLFRKYERENPEALEAALRKEIEGLSERMLGHAVPSHTLSVKEMHNVVHTMVLLKEKFLPSGEFEKLKARLVALGNRMNEGTYGDTYSPTLGHASFMVLLCIAAADDAEMEVTDVPCAFPNTPRDPKDGRVIVRLTGMAAEMWCEINPEDRVMLNRNGHLLIDLVQYLYGMKDAPAAFHKYLKKILEEAGFEATISDVCLIKKFSKTGYFIAGGHVDDLLSVHKGDPSLKRDFENALARAFGDGIPLESKKIETEGNYVGMYIERDRKNRTIYLSQPQSIENIHDAYPDINWNMRAPTPSTSDLFSYDKNAGPEVNGEKVDPRRYLSKVMSGMYVTKTKPDVLKELTLLSSIKEPTERSEAMVDRVLVYIYQTRHKRLRLRPRGFKLGSFGDAGFATHPDGYSQSGLVITFGGTPFFFKCGKQRRVTLSSTDSEYDTLTELCKYLEWLKGLLEELEIYHYDPIKVYQDNKSTITLATGPGTFKRSKQNLIRYQYVKDLVKDGTIEIVWCSTKDMIADILTKVLVGEHFRSQVEGLGVV